MSKSCCNCYFDYFLRKINRNSEFLKKVKSLNSEKWPKIPWVQITVQESGARLVRSKWSDLANGWPKAAGPQGWYCQASGLLFHACEVCICKLLNITTAADSSIVREILNRTCYFINLQQTTTEKNCLDKAYSELNSGGKMWKCFKFCLFSMWKQTLFFNY